MKYLWLTALVTNLAAPLWADFTVTLLLASNPYHQPTGDYGRAFEAQVSTNQLSIDPAGNLYIVDYPNSGCIGCSPVVVRKITPDGRIQPVTGNGLAPLIPGQRVPALLAAVGSYPLFPPATVTDRAGNLYISSGPILYRVGTDGMMEDYAVVSGVTRGVTALTADRAGNVYVLANRGNLGDFLIPGGPTGATAIFVVRPDRTVAPFAGSGTAGFSGDGGPAISAQINATDIVADDVGNLYIADSWNSKTRKVDTTGTITTLVEAGGSSRLAIDTSGNLYLEWEGSVRRMKPSGQMDYVAGTLAGHPPVGGAMAADGNGNLYFANIQLTRVDSSGAVSLVAGCGCYGDGVPFTWAQMGNAVGLARDGVGNLYFSDQLANMVRRITPAGIIETVAGTGEAGFSGDGGPAKQARVSSPAGLAFDSAGNLYIADMGNQRVRKVGVDGNIQTVAGDGENAYRGDGVAAASTALANPQAVAVDSAGNIYIADTGNARIRKVGLDGIIQTIAGDRPGTTGDGGPAAQALLINPRGLAFDRKGNLLITDSSAQMVRRITPAGSIERVSGTGKPGSAGDGGPAVAAQDWTPWGIAVDAAGNIYIGDTGSTTIRMIDSSGTIRTLFRATGFGLDVDAAGNIWIAGSSLSFASQAGSLPPLPLAPAIFDCVTYCYPAGGISSAASGQWHVIAPGEILTINGQHLGPDVAVSASFSAGRLTSTLGGVQVLFDGIAAPLLSVQAQQIQAIAPFEINGKTRVTITVEYLGRSSNPAVVAVLPAVPGLFATYGSAAAVNQDGSVNDFRNPAPLGSIVSLFATGAGQTTPPGADGQAGSMGSIPVLPVSAFIVISYPGDWQPIPVTYAGSSPGLVSGALQVNVKLPDQVAQAQYYGFNVAIAIGGAWSQPVLLAVKQPN